MTTTAVAAASSPTITASTTTATFSWTPSNATGANVIFFQIGINSATIRATNMVALAAAGIAWSPIGQVTTIGAATQQTFMGKPKVTTAVVTTITFTGNISAVSMGATAQEFHTDIASPNWTLKASGLDTSGSTISPTFPTISDTLTTDLYFGCLGWYTTGSISTNPGTAGWTYDNASGVVYRVATLNGANTTGYTMTQSVSWIAQAAILSPSNLQFGHVAFDSGYSGMFYHEENNVYRDGSCGRSSPGRRLRVPRSERSGSRLRGVDRSGLRWG